MISTSTHSIAPSVSATDERGSGRRISQPQSFTFEGYPERVNEVFQSECDSYSALGKQHAIERWSEKHHKAFARLIVMPTWKALYKDAYKQQMAIEQVKRGVA